MKTPKKDANINAPQPALIIETDDERRLRDMNRSDIEKFRLFTQMLHRNALLKKAKITYKE